MHEAVPNKSSFTRARQRLGEAALESVFRKLAGPVAPLGLLGGFYRGMRVAAVDGFVLDAPDIPANRAELGGLLDARVGAFSGGERELAVAMAGRAAGMPVIMDRGFPGVELWKAYTQAGAHLLLRARSSVARRPVEHLTDGTYLARMNLASQKLIPKPWPSTARGECESYGACGEPGALSGARRVREASRRNGLVVRPEPRSGSTSPISEQGCETPASGLSQQAEGAEGSPTARRAEG